MGRKIIYGRSQGSGIDRPVAPTIRLTESKGHGQVRVTIPRSIGVAIGSRSHFWFNEEQSQFGVSFEEGGRLKVHGSNSGSGSVFVLGSVDNHCFEMLQTYRWEFGDVERDTPFVESVTKGIFFVGKKGSTKIENPKPRKKGKKVS